MLAVIGSVLLASLVLEIVAFAGAFVRDLEARGGPERRHRYP
jgi:hypothetical protein